MTISLKHSFESPKADGTDSTLVQPSNWNAEHAISLAAGKVIGRVSGSAGAAQELPLSFDPTLQSMIPPVGTTAERPATPAAGMMRYNSTTLKLEIFTNSAWTPVGGSAAVSATAPTSPQPGDLWYDSSVGQLKVYSGTAWVVSQINQSVDVFSGNGATTVFTLSQSASSRNNVDIYISGVYQQKATYTVSGTTLTFTTAPPTGVDNIEAVATAPSVTSVPNDNSVSTVKIQNSAVTGPKIGSGAVDLTKLAASLQLLLTPTGMMAPFAGTAAPTGWLLCGGQTVSRTTFAALFAVIGTTYGVGDGTTTFNLPDLRGRTVAGKDDMNGTAANRLTGQSGGVAGATLGASGGAEVHTLSEAQLPAHSHTYGPKTGRFGANGQTYASDEFQPSAGDSDRGTQTMTSNLTGSGSAHNNVQPTIISNYIIKA